MENKIILNKIRLHNVKFIIDYKDHDHIYVNYSGQNNKTLDWLCQGINKIKILHTSKLLPVNTYVDINIQIFTDEFGKIYEVFGWC